jgi:capsular polysaccharide biosynthesis protein
VKDEKVIIRDILSTLWRYKLAIVMIFIMTLGFTFTLTKVLKKKYKSEFEINVYSKYFKNALISDIIPGVYQIPEMRFTIDSMVKEAISDDYIDQLAMDYNIYKIDTDEVSLAKNRQFLKDRFSLFSTGGQSYKVSFSDSDPYVAKKIADETLERVKMQFINSRIQTIEMVKQMMFQRLQALSASQKITNKGEEKALASKSPDVLMAQLKKIDANLSALSKQYNTSHPKIQELLTRRATIKIWLEEFDNSPEASADMASLTMPTDKLINGQITSKFYTKYHDFTMALDIEKKSLESYIGIIQRPQLPISPIWPKKRLFAAVGFLFAMIFSFLYVFIKEVMVPSRRELLAQEARELGCEYLGAIYVNQKEINNKAIVTDDINQTI